MRVEKDSSTPFLNEIPREWKVIRLRYLFNFSTGVSTTKSEYVLDGVKCITYGDIHSKLQFIFDNNAKYMLNKIDKSYLETKSNLVIKDGDFVFADTSEDLEGCGNFIYSKTSNGETILSASHTVIAKPLCKFEGDFLAYLLTTDIARSQLRSKVNGIKVFSITQTILKTIKVCLPPLPLQKQIADFLNQKCEKIDFALTQLEKSIEKLKEYKQSLITEAVTKGLDPNVPMKDSGVEWIGEIPTHYSIIPLHQYYFERKCKNKGNIEKNVLSLSYGNIVRRNVETNMGLLPQSFETYNVVLKDNIVLRLTDLQNDKRSLRTGLVKEKGIITSAYLTLESIDISDSRYNHYLLHSYDIRKILYNMGNGVRQNLKFDELKKMPLVVPPYKEQKEISDYLDRKSASIEKAIEQKQSLIDKLTEYKKSLIYECVTGKVEV